MAVRLDAIGIVVAEMARALAFYRCLGLAIGAEQDDEDHVEFVCPNGLRLMWDTEALVKGFAPEWTPPAPGGSRLGLAFLCESAADVDAGVERLRGAGYRIAREPWDAFWGQRYAQVADPDGNVLDLFAPLGGG